MKAGVAVDLCLWVWLVSGCPLVNVCTADHTASSVTHRCRACVLLGPCPPAAATCKQRPPQTSAMCVFKLAGLLTPGPKRTQSKNEGDWMLQRRTHICNVTRLPPSLLSSPWRAKASTAWVYTLSSSHANANIPGKIESKQKNKTLHGSFHSKSMSNQHPNHHKLIRRESRKLLNVRASHS